MSQRLTGFKGNVPGVTEAEFRAILDYWTRRAESIKWREDRTNPFREMFVKEGRKSYIIEVKLKESWP